MTWDYRVVHKIENGDEEFAIWEIYYGDDGKPNGYVHGERSPSGETYDEARSDAALMLEAFNKPWIEYSDLVKLQLASAPAQEG